MPIKMMCEKPLKRGERSCPYLNAIAIHHSHLALLNGNEMVPSWNQRTVARVSESESRGDRRTRDYRGLSPQ